MEYRIRRTRPWGRDRLYRGASNEPREWTPGGNPAARALDSLRRLAPIFTRWTHYTRQELEAWVESPPGRSAGWLSVDELLEAVARDLDYKVQARPTPDHEWVVLRPSGPEPCPPKKPGRRRLEDDPAARDLYEKGERLRAQYPGSPAIRSPPVWGSRRPRTSAT